jgi:hypothetical protein
MGGADFSKKTSTTLSLIKIYRMSLISAGSISLDSTFNREAQIQVQFRLAEVGGTPMAALMASWNTCKDIFFHTSGICLDL